jgi:hypothetical protein
MLYADSARSCIGRNDIVITTPAILKSCLLHDTKVKEENKFIPQIRKVVLDEVVNMTIYVM